MTLSKKQKRWLIIGGVVVSVLAVVVISINLILASIIVKKITNALENHPEKKYHITLNRVGVNILNGNINLRGLEIEPDSLFVEQLKKGQLHQKMVLRLKLPLFRLAGLNLYEAVTDGNIDIRKILFKNASVQVLVGKKILQKLPDVGEKQKSFQLDSIRIEGLSGIRIGKIELKGFEIEFFDIVENKIISRNKGLNLEVKGIESTKLPGGDDYFAFDLKQASVELTDEEWELPGGLYRVGLKNMKLTLSDSLLVIKKFMMKPQIKDRFKMAEKLKFTAGIFNVAVEEIRISSIDVFRLLHHGDLIIGEILVKGMDLDIFKDKRKPWDYDKRPEYPHQALRTMDFPLFIGTIKTEGSKLKYWEESEKSFGNLSVTLDDLRATLTHITSLKDSTRKPMAANLKAKLFGVAPMTVDFLFPLNSHADTFFVSGSLGKAKMKKFNPALYPALGMKITAGTLNSLTFKARANRKYIDGEMVMMYDGLETEVVKKKDKDVDKFLSWLANSVARKSNPGKNDRLRTVPMHFDREMYKGFINIVWKGIQTGLVNTISPAGKEIKEEKKAASKPRDESAKKKKKKRRKKKKE